MLTFASNARWSTFTSRSLRLALAVFGGIVGDGSTSNQAAETVVRKLSVDGFERSYRVFVPDGVDVQAPTPVVLAFHPFGFTAKAMEQVTQLNATAEQGRFVVAYPEGTGSAPFLLSWNSGGVLPPFDSGLPDDVAFTNAVLDDLATLVTVDSRRTFATGYSAGGAMCYRLAAELSHRIAAIAPVAGTQSIEFPAPLRPVPICHFHGTADSIVPIDGPGASTPPFLTFLSLQETIDAWTRINGSAGRPVTQLQPNVARDGTLVLRTVTDFCDNDVEIVIYKILEGGHTWPGASTRNNPITGRTSQDISANAVLWDFFKRHPLPE